MSRWVSMTMPAVRELAIAATILFAGGCRSSDEPAAKAGVPIKPVAACKDAPDACVERGLVYLASNRPELGPSAATSLFDVACASGSLRGCTFLGRSIIMGWGVAQDTAKGVALLASACTRGEPHGCQLQAIFAEGGARDPLLARARDLLEKRCTAGEAAYCGELALDLALRSDANSADRQTSLLKIACDGGEAGFCGHLASRRLAAGETGEREIARMRVLIESQCEGGNAQQCGQLAQLFEQLDDKPRALALNQRACDGGDSPACMGLMVGCQGRSPPDCKPLFDRFCTKGGDSWVCTQCLADADGLQLCGLAERPETSGALLERACAAKIGDACFALSSMTESASERARNIRLGCDAGSARACMALAESATGAMRRELRGRACLSGDVSACDGASPTP